MTEAHRGFFPVVRGETVTVNQGGGVVFAARGDLSIREGGGQLIAAGNNLTINEGGGAFLLAGNKLSIDNGGGAIALASTVEIHRGIVGVALAAQIDVSEDSTVVVGPREAAVIGAVTAVLLAFLNRLMRR